MVRSAASPTRNVVSTLASMRSVIAYTSCKVIAPAAHASTPHASDAAGGVLDGNGPVSRAEGDAGADSAGMYLGDVAGEGAVTAMSRRWWE